MNPKIVTLLCTLVLAVAGGVVVSMSLPFVVVFPLNFAVGYYAGALLIPPAKSYGS